MEKEQVLVQEESAVIVAPVPNAEDYTVSADVWEALTAEINSVVARIDAGEQLTPEDVVNVRSLKKQVEQYLTTFNKAMRDAQATYKSLVNRQLEDLGYSKIENYIQAQREKQTKEQNARLAAKQAKLKEIVETVLAGTKILKDTAMATELLPAFTRRFPNINSAAKTKEINNWGPYEAVVKTSLNMLDVFFGDPAFQGATQLPVTSATMQQLLTYIRDGNLEHLASMREVFAKDAGLLYMRKLKAEITSKEIAVAKIAEITGKEMDASEKITEISRIIRIAEAL